jgi:hypothetical protein
MISPGGKPSTIRSECDAAAVSARTYREVRNFLSANTGIHPLEADELESRAPTEGRRTRKEEIREARPEPLQSQLAPDPRPASSSSPETTETRRARRFAHATLAAGRTTRT